MTDTMTDREMFEAFCKQCNITLLELGKDTEQTIITLEPDILLEKAKGDASKLREHNRNCDYPYVSFDFTPDGKLTSFGSYMG